LDADLKATTNAEGHSIVKHKTVCPLLQALYEEEGKHEEKMAANGGERTVEAYFELATKAGQRGQLDKAIAAFNEVIQIAPHYADAHYNLGITLKAKGDFDAAIDAFNQAIRIDPEHAEAYFSLGVAFKAKGECDAAIDAYNQAIRINPDDAEFHTNLGNAFLGKRDFNAAIDAFNNALRLQPGFELARVNVAHACALTGDQTATLVSLERAADFGVTVPTAGAHFEFLRDDPRFIAVIARMA
jgi:tetratricopeptide (TPR) repeat protein